jgi:hypothetical protein
MPRSLAKSLTSTAAIPPDTSLERHLVADAVAGQPPARPGMPHEVLKQRELLGGELGGGLTPKGDLGYRVQGEAVRHRLHHSAPRRAASAAPSRRRLAPTPTPTTA